MRKYRKYGILERFTKIHLSCFSLTFCRLSGQTADKTSDIPLYNIYDMEDKFMSRYKSEQTAYSPQNKKNVPIWRLDTNTMTVTHFNPDTLTEESKTYHTDFIKYHLHYSDSHCHDRLRRLVNEGMIIQYLDELELESR